MTEINDIRDVYYNKEKSISEIAEKFGRDRKNDFNWPGKETGKGKCQPKLDPYRGAWQTDDLNAERRQRQITRRVYDRLDETEKGFWCSYRTVTSYVKRKKTAKNKTRH